ncbi:Hsp90 protein-domain-containing protein [Crucibulum laeve]|uniref:Hsp90 protein-domain-containing protein n=1 Tax=Crucibulum laeve TaxID=68775 RepID=A0A5C3MF57_9AGAR|nr:Hsp90 protein-domain-containing protein [Crucibulum laeve]
MYCLVGHGVTSLSSFQAILTHSSGNTMSAQPPAAVPRPLLPLGWTEHIAPGGQVYYYNAQTTESTYMRPLPSFPTYPAVQSQPAKKKEKPLIKTPIPGTEWLRVTTTEGNTFYSHKLKKQSIWTVPEEIKDAIAALEAQEHARETEQSQKAEAIAAKKTKELDKGKRKAEEVIPVDEVVITKKAKVGDEEEDNDDAESDSSEEEEWQREAAIQLAQEAEEEKIRREEENKRLKEAEVEAEKSRTAALINMPARVELSIDEAKALFKTLLREKDINPLHPWDTALPKFVSDPRYVLLPSVTARREAFDEYCRDRARELRESAVKKDKAEAANPKDEFERLLKDEVKSTRSSWTDFRRAWKKDRRFYGWGRDDREREKRFREYLKELSEKKRTAAEKAEADFFILLKERADLKKSSVWKEVKRDLYDDPRYDAVGSSSLREELFNTFLKGQNLAYGTKEDGEVILSKEDDESSSKLSRHERKERAVKEREQKVRADRGRLEADIERSRLGINKEEGEREFRTLLTDAIREPQATWDSSLAQLKTDPRFTNSPLPLNQQLHLFHAHIAHLRTKHLDSLHALFQSHAPSLATRFTDLPLDSLLSSLPVTKLGYDIDKLESEFEKWQRELTFESRKAFDEMLSENSFVEFWGRLGKIGGEGVDGGLKVDNEDIGEEEGEGITKVDMKALAKSVDIREMEKVLKNDKRFIMFDHVPEQRERWLRVEIFVKTPIVVSLSLFAAHVFAAEETSGVPKVKHDYQHALTNAHHQSDVARLRKIVINSLYSHQEIFLRELISNANDALEKLRLTALTDKNAWDGSNPLNITIKAEKNEDGKGGKIIISDTGIGMSAEELTANLGTLAKSGTSEFLAKAEGEDSTGTGNLIGAFGVGFYSSFLVADRVQVASIPPKSEKVPEPVQHIFSSSADDSSFEIFPDPRGNTLGRGTEITLYLKDDALEYLEISRITELVNKHSSYSSSFPIYLFEQRVEEVPDEDVTTETSDASSTDAIESEPTTSATDEDEDEAIVEEVTKDEEKPEPPAPKMKNVTVEEWVRLNAQAPLWTRDPKNVTDDEYTLFYNAFFKDFTKPLAWQHFSGDSGSGTSFKAIVFLPSKLSENYWQNPLEHKSKDIKLMVKRVFITSDLGDDALPKWISWVKVVVDADDLPLNVSRETLQSNRFLRQLKQMIIKRVIQLFTKIAEEDGEKWEKIQETYGSVLKLGAVEDTKNRDKLMALTRYTTNQRNSTSLDQYLENKKKGQKQIFYLAEMGKTPEDLAQSVFVEKLHARGYEVLLLTEPLDEIMVGTLRQWKNVPFQDVAKAGLKFGDEDLDEEEEKEQQKILNEKFKPLLEWLKVEAKDVVRDVVLSNRLVKSACAIVADAGGYTANVQKMMSASNAKGNRGGILHEYALKAKLLEINPKSPLIEGLLRRVQDLPTDEDEKDIDAEEELKEVASILIDGALVRSGFEVPDNNRFFSRMDRVLRRSLGVSETAPTDETVKPAPPVDPELPTEDADAPAFDFPMDGEDDGKARVIVPDHMKNDIQIDMEEIDEDGNPVVQHDEL